MKDCRKLKDYNSKNKDRANCIDDDESLFVLSEITIEDESILILNEQALFEIKSINNEEWILDSGATSHVACNEKLFDELIATESRTVKLADGTRVEILGKGTCKVSMNTETGETSKAKLTDVLFVPKLKGNFISIRKLNQRGIGVYFHDEKADLIKEGKVIANARVSDDLFKLNQVQICTTKATIEIINKKACIHKFHRIFGHKNIESIKRMINQNLVTGIEMIKCNCESQCEICIESKLTRKSFKKEKPKTTKSILELVHTDLCGPMRTETASKKKYILTFIDDYSRFTKIYLLRNKSETLQKMIEFVELMKTQKGIKPRKFNSDRGDEYVNKLVKGYLDSEGIECQYTSPSTPQLNGVSERKNRTFIEMVRCMLNQANLPKNMWGEAVTTATYIQNRLITSSINKIPYELWYDKRPQLKSLAAFGSECFVKILDKNRGKLDNCSRQLILLGFDENNCNIYRCFDKEENKIVISRDVVFKRIKPSNNQTEVYFKGQRNADNVELPVNADDGLSSDSEHSSETETETETDSTGSSKQRSTSSTSNSTPEIRISTRTTKGQPPNR